MPTPVAVPPPNGPRLVAICEVRVTTESRALATTAVMSSCWTVVVPPAVVTSALGEDAGAAGAPGPGRRGSTTAKVEPDARTAARRAEASTVLPVRGRLGKATAIWLGAGSAGGHQPGWSTDLAGCAPFGWTGVGAAGWVGSVGNIARISGLGKRSGTVHGSPDE